MGIGDIGGGYRRLREEPEPGERTQQSSQSSRSPTAQRVREATTNVISSLRSIGSFSQKIGNQIGNQLGQLSSTSLPHPTALSLQKGLSKVHQSVSNSLNKVFHFIENHLQSHLKRGDALNQTQNIKDFQNWLSEAKASNSSIDRSEFVGLEGLTSKEAMLRKPSLPQMRKSIEGRIEDLTTKLTHLESELSKAVNNPVAFTSTKAGKAPDRVIEAKSYKTLPNTNRNLDKELKVLQNAIKSSKKELSAFDAHSAKLLGAEKKSGNTKRSEAATARRDVAKQERMARGEKSAAKATAGSERNRQVLQERRDKMKAYGARVRERSETASGEVPTARRALRSAEKALSSHDAIMKGVKDELARVFGSFKGDQLKDRVENKSQMLNMIQTFSKRDFGKEQMIDSLQYPRKIAEISDRVVNEMSDEQVMKLVQEGQKAAQKNEITYPKELRSDVFEKRTKEPEPFNLFKPIDGLYDRQIVRDLVKGAMAKAIADDQQIQKTSSDLGLDAGLKSSNSLAKDDEFIDSLLADLVDDASSSLPEKKEIDLMPNRVGDQDNLIKAIHPRPPKEA